VISQRPPTGRSNITSNRSGTISPSGVRTCALTMPCFASIALPVFHARRHRFDAIDIELLHDTVGPGLERRRSHVAEHRRVAQTRGLEKSISAWRSCA
jgi:hypothetical protein